MLTEKAIRDSVYCPLLWAQTEHTNKRVKGSPRVVGPANIHRALETGEPNKTVMVELCLGGLKATSYQTGSDLWVTTKVSSEYLLLAVREVMLRSDDTITVCRVLWREPVYAETVEAETNIQRILWMTFRKFFPGYDLVVESSFRKSSGAFVMREAPTRREIAEAVEFVEWVAGLYYGEIPLTPRYENCRWCKWDECQERIGPPDDPPRQRGTPQMGVL